MHENIIQRHSSDIEVREDTHLIMKKNKKIKRVYLEISKVFLKKYRKSVLNDFQIAFF